LFEFLLTTKISFEGKRETGKVDGTKTCLNWNNNKSVFTKGQYEVPYARILPLIWNFHPYSLSSTFKWF